MAESADHRRGTHVPARVVRIPRPRPETGVDLGPWSPGIPAPRAVPSVERWDG